MKMKNAATDALPLSGALFFAAVPKGFDKRACNPRVSSGRKTASKS
jgi:hypothetical protein